MSLSDWCNNTGDQIFILKTISLHIWRKKFCKNYNNIILSNQIQIIQAVRVLSIVFNNTKQILTVLSHQP